MPAQGAVASRRRRAHRARPRRRGRRSCRPIGRAPPRPRPGTRRARPRGADLERGGHGRVPTCSATIPPPSSRSEHPRSRHVREGGEVVGPGKRRTLAGGSVCLAAGQHPPEHGHDAVEPEPEERLEESARPCDLEHGELPARSEDAGQLAQAPPGRRGCGRRTRRSRRRTRRRRRAARGRLPHPLDRAGLLPRPLEHPLGEVEPDDASPATLGLDGEVTGAAARVEHAVSRPHDLRAASLRQRRSSPAVTPGSSRRTRARSGRTSRERTRARGCLTRGSSALTPAGVSALSIPIWSRHRATTKSTRSSIVSAPW